MRRQFLFVFAFALLSATNISAQSIRLPDHFGGWTATGSPFSAVPSPAGASPWDETGPGGTRRVLAEPLYQETGAKLEEHRAYAMGKSQVFVYVAELRDPSSGYEIYTSKINPGMRPSILGKNSAVDRDRLVALVGNIVFEVRPPQAISTNDLQALVNVLQAGADQTPLPPVRAYLPEGEMLDGSQRYALGTAGFRATAGSTFAGLAEKVGFNDGAEAMFAEYKDGKEKGVLLLLDYPTPQLATYHQKHLELGLREISKLEETPIERRGSLLMMVLSPSSAAYAEKLRKSVNYETQVTWNEPTHTITDPPWARVLANIFICTGIFMLAAVVLGIAFGGVRVVTKIFFPGKVFDRPERMEILQLGLSGKRIDPRDFY